MLLFHGTGGGREILDSIFRDGLVPAPRPWAHEATGIDEHVFACTTPMGSRGGDPIAFAQRRVWREHHDAWLVVLDVSPDAIHGAVPNMELQQWWRTRAFVNEVFRQYANTRRVIGAMRERRAPARDLLEYRVKSTAEGLCEGEPDADTLVQFERAYLRATARDKARVAASYRLSVPSWFTDDPHYPHCPGCTTCSRSSLPRRASTTARSPSIAAAGTGSISRPSGQVSTRSIAGWPAPAILLQ